MSHRGSSTTNLQLPPFKVLYGRTVIMSCDWGLLTDTYDSPSLTAYYKEVAPKLEILQEIAMQNAAEPAAGQREGKNIGATPPSYKVADQVLLHDAATKIGEAAKLTTHWTGPYIVVEVLPSFNYKLQYLKTGRDLKRSVHADRLRPLRAMLNDYRLPQPDTTHTLFEITTQQRHLKVRITRGDLLVARTRTIVHLADEKLSDTSAFSSRLYDAAGTRVQSECHTHVADELPRGHCFITLARDLTPIRRIVHYVRYGDISTVRADSLACLQAADVHKDNIVSIAMLFFNERDNANTYWDTAQQVADEIADFDKIDDQNVCSLQRIDITCASLLAADVLTTVFRHILVANPMQGLTAARQLRRRKQYHPVINDTK